MDNITKLPQLMSAPLSLSNTSKEMSGEVAALVKQDCGCGYCHAKLGMVKTTIAETYVLRSGFNGMSESTSRQISNFNSIRKIATASLVYKHFNIVPAVNLNANALFSTVFVGTQTSQVRRDMASMQQQQSYQIITALMDSNLLGVTQAGLPDGVGSNNSVDLAQLEMQILQALCNSLASRPSYAITQSLTSNLVGDLRALYHCVEKGSASPLTSTLTDLLKSVVLIENHNRDLILESQLIKTLNSVNLGFNTLLESAAPLLLDSLQDAMSINSNRIQNNFSGVENRNSLGMNKPFSLAINLLNQLVIADTAGQALANASLNTAGLKIGLPVNFALSVALQSTKNLAGALNQSSAPQSSAEKNNSAHNTGKLNSHAESSTKQSNTLSNGQSLAQQQNMVAAQLEAGVQSQQQAAMLSNLLGVTNIATGAMSGMDNSASSMVNQNMNHISPANQPAQNLSLSLFQTQLRQEKSTSGSAKGQGGGRQNSDQSDEDDTQEYEEDEIVLLDDDEEENDNS